MCRGRVVNRYLPCGGWLQGVYRDVHQAPPEEFRSDRAKAEEGIQGLGIGGGKSRLLAVAEKEGHVVGKTRVLGVAAGGDWERSLLSLHHREIFREKWSKTSMRHGSQLMTLQLPNWHHKRCVR